MRKTIKKKKNTKSEKILWSLFIFLVINTVILSVILLNKKESIKKAKSNDYTISILKENITRTLEFDISNMELRDLKEIKLKIINYKGKKRNSREITYSVFFLTNEDVDIKLYKSDDERNLLTYKEKIISGLTLKKDKKQEDLYYVIIKCNSKTDKKAKLTIRVSS